MGDRGELSAPPAVVVWHIWKEGGDSIHRARQFMAVEAGGLEAWPKGEN